MSKGICREVDENFHSCNARESVNIFIALLVSVVSLFYSSVTSVRAATAKGPEGDQTVRILPLTKTCTIPEVAQGSNSETYTLTRAFRIKSLPDVRTLVYQTLESDAPDIGIDDFVVIEATGDIYLSRHLRMIRPDSLYPPTGINYHHGIPSKTQYVAFPVKPEETTFTIYFCSFSSPTKITLDFSTAEIRKGTYGTKEGLVLH